MNGYWWAIFASVIAIVAYRSGQDGERRHWQNWTDCETPMDACVELHNHKVQRDGNLDTIVREINEIGARK